MLISLSVLMNRDAEDFDSKLKSLSAQAENKTNELKIGMNQIKHKIMIS